MRQRKENRNSYFCLCRKSLRTKRTTTTTVVVVVVVVVEENHWIGDNRRVPQKYVHKELVVRHNLEEDETKCFSNRLFHKEWSKWISCPHGAPEIA
jgi:hypothetical protein